MSDPSTVTIQPGKKSMTEDINHLRRRLVGAAALSVAATQLGVMGAAQAQSGNQAPSRLPAVSPGTHTSFASLKQVNAGVLNVGYAEVGSADGKPVILLHGWPYDIHTYVDVAPLLAEAGYRVIVPYLRGYGTTRFLSDDTPRNGQQSAIAVDIIALMDALRIEKAVVAQPRAQQDAAPTQGRVAVVVSILFRDGTRPGRVREIPARFRQVDLGARLPEVDLRRGYL